MITFKFPLSLNVIQLSFSRFLFFIPGILLQEVLYIRVIRPKESNYPRTTKSGLQKSGQPLDCSKGDPISSIQRLGFFLFFRFDISRLFFRFDISRLDPNDLVNFLGKVDPTTPPPPLQLYCVLLVEQCSLYPFNIGLLSQTFISFS